MRKCFYTQVNIDKELYKGGGDSFNTSVAVNETSPTLLKPSSKCFLDITSSFVNENNRKKLQLIINSEVSSVERETSIETSTLDTPSITLDTAFITK